VVAQDKVLVGRELEGSILIMWVRGTRRYGAVRYELIVDVDALRGHANFVAGHSDQPLERVLQQHQVIARQRSARNVVEADGFACAAVEREVADEVQRNGSRRETDIEMILFIVLESLKAQVWLGVSEPS